MLTDHILRPVAPLLRRLQKLMGQTVYRYFTNVSWGLFERIVRMITGVFIGIIVARHLGPTQFGLLNYVTSMVFLFSGLATYGLDTVVVRDLVRAPEKHCEILGTSLAIRLALSAVSVVCLAIAAVCVERDPHTRFLIVVAGGSLIVSSFQNIASFFEAAVWGKKAALARALALVAMSVLRVYWVLIDQDLTAFVVATVMEAGLTSLFFVLSYSRTHSILKWKFDRRVFSSLMKDGWAMVIASLGVVLYMKIDQVMITKMLGAEENGVYSVAARISEIWYFIPTVICNTVYPAIVEVSGDYRLYKARFLKMFDLMFVVSSLILVGVLLVSSWFVNTFYGRAYAAAVPCLYIHIFGIVFVFIGIAASKWVLTEGKLIYTSIRTMFAAVVNIVLNLLLLEDYGIQGAAAATVVAQVLSSYLFYLFIPRYRDLFWLQTKAMLLPLRAVARVIHGRKAG